MIGYGLAAAPVTYAYMSILIMYMKYAVGALAFSRNQLDEVEHRRIRAALDARAAAGNRPDPI